MSGVSITGKTLVAQTTATSSLITRPPLLCLTGDFLLLPQEIFLYSSDSCKFYFQFSYRYTQMLTWYTTGRHCWIEGRWDPRSLTLSLLQEGVNAWQDPPSSSRACRVVKVEWHSRWRDCNSWSLLCRCKSRPSRRVKYRPMWIERGRYRWVYRIFYLICYIIVIQVERISKLYVFRSARGIEAGSFLLRAHRHCCYLFLQVFCCFCHYTFFFLQSGYLRAQMLYVIFILGVYCQYIFFIFL